MATGKPAIAASLVRAFAVRDRTSIERLKREHWVEQRKRAGAQATLQIAHALYEHARLVQPLFPDASMREADLRDHVAQKQLLDRVAHAFAVR
jgi:hypothetical protein